MASNSCQFLYIRILGHVTRQNSYLTNKHVMSFCWFPYWLGLCFKAVDRTTCCHVISARNAVDRLESVSISPTRSLHACICSAPLKSYWHVNVTLFSRYIAAIWTSFVVRDCVLVCLAAWLSVYRMSQKVRVGFQQNSYSCRHCPSLKLMNFRTPYSLSKGSQGQNALSIIGFENSIWCNITIERLKR